MRRVWPGWWEQFRASWSTGCSLVSPARQCWPVQTEFAWLSGVDAADSGRSGMKSVFRTLPVAGLLLGLGLASPPASAQQRQGAPAAPALKQCSAPAMDAAREILTFKRASTLYANVIPNIVL